MPLGFCSIFQFLMISGILMIYLIFTLTLQSKRERDLYPHFSEDETKAQNGCKDPRGYRAGWCQRSEPPTCWTRV